MSVRVGFIGCGSIGSVHTQAAQMCSDLGEVVGGSDINNEQRNSFTAKTSAPAFSDALEMLNTTKPDAVVISTPPNVRYAMIKECINRRIAILCEKPLALNFAEAKKIVALAKPFKKVCATGFCHRFNAAVCTMKDMLQNGDLGEPIEFINFFVGPASWLADTWRTDISISGGGNFYDNGVHSVDLFSYLFGKIKSSSGMARYMWPGRGEDSGFMMIVSESGVVGQITTSWVYPYNASTIEIVGTKGAVRFSYDAIDELKICNDSGSWKTIKINEDRRFVNQMRAFLQAVNGQPQEQLATFEDGMEAIGIVEQVCKNKINVNKN
ncbi:MAG: hypothetical protein A2Y12_20560 [Planctomycetes bacterium GWF2_42_9]|nr:MAG: hypothetical protein A2Y12_20560 [Planctomycetes bacterium GWF2_42_9]